MTRPVDSLVAAVCAAKAKSPLALVTIVVPSPGAARDVLHHLARRGGVANTRVLTVPQLVAALATPALAPRLPLRYPLLEAAIERVLMDAPGAFHEVAQEPATSRALSAAAWELTTLSHPEMAYETPLVTDLLRVYRIAVERLTSRYFLQHEAYAAAGENLPEVGKIIAYRLQPTTAADAALIERLENVGVVVASDPVAAPTQVIHTSDADDEVRAVVRLVRKHLADGVPGHRMGIFYPTEDPYLPLLQEHLTAGNVTFHAPECHTLVDRPIGRSVLGLLSLDTTKMPRRELLSILADGALTRPRVDNKPLSQPQLERLTRHIEPIVGGDDWHKLMHVAAEKKHHPSSIALYDYVQRLQKRLASTGYAPDWGTVAAELGSLLDVTFRTQTSDVGHADLTAVRQAVADLDLLDGLAAVPSPARVHAAVAVRLESFRGTLGNSRIGVTVAPLSAGVGRELDISIVVGVAEGMVPGRRADNPLLPPDLVGITAREHVDQQLWAYTNALNAGTIARIATFPRGSLRGGAEKVPSRWLVPALTDLAGRKVNVVEWQRQTQDATSIVAVESFDVAAQHADERIGASAASPTEWRLRELAGVPAYRRRGALDDPVINLGMQMRSDRLNGRFTRFNGNLAEVCELISTFDHPVSPTGLETWVASPYQFFLEHILRLTTLDDPDEAAQIDALTRGNLVHAILERYVIDSIEGTELDFARLSLVAQEILDNAEADNPGWLQQLWAKDRGIIVRDLADWFHHDHADKASGWKPTHAEEQFGTEATVVLLIGNNMIRFRGKIDRIDTHLDGRVRITDYKTGKVDKKYNEISVDTPTGGGKQFQLPVYGLFARTFGDNVEARYWFVTRKGEFTSVGYPVTDSVVATLADDLALVHRCISDGQFPPKVADTFWDLPVIDLLGRSGLNRAWANLENVRELADYVQKYGGRV
ncbi:PD-(D/E)XK nuclease family protein [Gordonia sp. KTR9]|uniref:PD-(D/E)XK nuclease family protein n=1 Tax=Gordonia sp. KTR9 TaxID=337191 RepID=UPI00027DE175|nr:PD-(D/E)XK nuclease family protein [Gordonia sp. KTR9]AFR49078.1 RecB family exonuclease [Gordonia sp. KTR9]